LNLEKGSYNQKRDQSFFMTGRRTEKRNPKGGYGRQKKNFLLKGGGRMEWKRGGEDN